MKKVIVGLFCCLSAYAMAQSHQPTPNHSLISTEVLPGNQVAFRIYAPAAKNVTLRSDDKWDKVDFKKDSRGVWEGIWSNVQPGAYRYRVVVDGVNVYDPKAPSARENTSLFMMTSGDEFFAMKEDVPHGGITKRTYYSKTLKQMRRLHIWTPAGFEKSKEQLPVLYLIHGGGDTDNAWSTIGCAGNILDNLLAEGKIKPMVVVMPNSSVESDGLLDRVPIFTKDLMTGIIPFIESNYNVYTDAIHRAIMGLSLGGLQTLEAATSHYDDFGYVGVLSSGWWISDTWAKKRGMTDNKEKRAAHLKKIASDFNKSVKLLYFTQGGPEDLAYDNGMETLKLFDAAGINYKYSEAPGGHTWMVWRKNLWELTPLLFTDTFAQSSQVLDYLYSISEKKTLAGQHNREPNAKPAMWTDYIKETTGKYPAFWSGDFLFQQDNIDNRWTMIYEAKKQWDNGAVINLMWHACPPDMDEPCGWNPGVLNELLDDDQWKALLTDGTPLNERWTKRMDDIAVYLQYLEDHGVEVLFRPFHEMNQGKFWWGGRRGPDGTAKLYRYLHDYFTKTKGLSNLVWVWDMQDMTRDFEEYNPGDEYWDVFAFDVYEKGFDSSWYEYILPIVGEKPMAIGECSKLPSSDVLASQPRWVFFMPWAELVKRANTTEEIQRIYDDPRVITRDEMPGWKMSLAGSPSIASSQEKYTEVRDTLPIRETRYMIRVPEKWNGTLINDLDYCSNANSPRNVYLLEHGYALSGTGRRADRFNNYDPAHEAHDFVAIFDIFESTFGKPKRIIQLGCSGGGTVTLAMAEIHPDRIDGAIAACAATSPWMANTHLDGLFVLQALLAPDLPIVNLGAPGAPDITELGKAWEEVINKAQQTPEGRARIALAITIGQWPAWGGSGKSPVPKPDPNDAHALQESMYHSVVRLIPSKRTWGTTMLELAGRGQLRWNTGVDYKKLYKNGDVLYKKTVETLYKDADLSLDIDLKKINAFPRIATDVSAIKYWSSPGRTHIGEPKVPLLRIHTIGDGLVYPTMAQGYEELVGEKGYTDLFRSAYVDRWGHCSFSLAEWLAAIDTMVQRLDTGVWPSTDPEALNKLGMSLDPTSTTRFCNYREVKKYNRTWVPTATDFLGQFNSEE